MSVNDVLPEPRERQIATPRQLTSTRRAQSKFELSDLELVGSAPAAGRRRVVHDECRTEGVGLRVVGGESIVGAVMFAEPPPPPPGCRRHQECSTSLRSRTRRRPRAAGLRPELALFATFHPPSMRKRGVQRFARQPRGTGAVGSVCRWLAGSPHAVCAHKNFA